MSKQARVPGTYVGRAEPMTRVSVVRLDADGNAIERRMISGRLVERNGLLTLYAGGVEPFTSRGQYDARTLDGRLVDHIDYQQFAPLA